MEEINIAMAHLPQDPFLLYIAGRIRFLRKEYEDAKIFLVKSYEMEPDSDTKNLLALCYFELEDYKQAVTIFRSILDKSPMNVNVLVSCAKCYEKLGDVEMALQNNVRIKNAANNLQAATLTKESAFTQYFPSISATGTGFIADKAFVQMDVAPGQNISLLKDGIIGGISFILYGMISAIGVRNVVENQVDFTNSRNLIIAAVILVSALGFNSIGGLSIVINPELTINLSGLAIAAILGILLNAVLPGNDYQFDKVSNTGDSMNFQV